MATSILHQPSPSAISHQPLTVAWRSSGSSATAGPFEIRPAIAHRRLAELRAGLAAAARRRQRPLLADLPHIDQIVDAAVRRQLAIIGAIEHEELAHLVEARSHPEADAEEQGVRFR